jgi:hypothetical protein
MAFSDEDIERAARNPAALKEDTPPFLRFTESTVEDREASLKAGRTIYAPIVKVYSRARGDTKSEVPAIVRGWTFETKQVSKDIQRPASRWVVPEDGGPAVEQKVMIDDTEVQDYKYRTPTTPWLDQLKEKLRNEFISIDYYDYCLEHLKAWEEKREMPIEGTPITGWNQITLAMQKNLIELGIRSVEEAAEMNEVAMDSIGMGSRDVKRKAINFLKTADNGVSSSEISHLQNENERMSDTISAFEEKMAGLERRIAEGSAENVQKKPGRPKKIDSEAA